VDECFSDPDTRTSVLKVFSAILLNIQYWHRSPATTFWSSVRCQGGQYDWTQGKAYLSWSDLAVLFESPDFVQELHDLRNVGPHSAAVFLQAWPVMVQRMRLR
jgi:hypothetical protein